MRLSRDHAKARGSLTTKWRTIAHGHYNRMFQGQFYVTHKRSDILEGRYFILVYSLRQNCIENHNNGVLFAVSPLFTSEDGDNTCGSACEQAKSGTFLIILGPQKRRPNSLDRLNSLYFYVFVVWSNSLVRLK